MVLGNRAACLRTGARLIIGKGGMSLKDYQDYFVPNSAVDLRAWHRRLARTRVEACRGGTLA
jgi:hypothetical protein